MPSNRYRLIRQEVNRLVNEPSRLGKVLSPRSIRMFAARVRHTSGGWTQGEDDLTVRRYETYEAYLGHQRSKLALLDIDDYDARLRTSLRSRLSSVDGLTGRSALCLAARRGGEVRAFLDHDAFAVGVDLNPGPENRWVLTGDFHDLQFADSTIDFVYTNSLDHAFDVSKVISEVRRVLKPEGELLLDLMLGEDEAQNDTRRGGGFGEWESATWRRVQDVVSLCQDAGFRESASEPISEPWSGQFVRLVSEPRRRGR